MTKLSTRQSTMLQHSETWASNFLNLETRVIAVNHWVRSHTVNNHELTLSLEPRHPLSSPAFCPMLSIYWPGLTTSHLCYIRARPPEGPRKSSWTARLASCIPPGRRVSRPSRRTSWDLRATPSRGPPWGRKAMTGWRRCSWSTTWRRGSPRC